jgi:hypothetical protein
VGVVGGRDSGADVEKLPDPGFGSQEPHNASEERPVRADRHDDPRVRLHYRVAGCAVRGEVVLAAQPIVVHPGAVRHGGI